MSPTISFAAKICTFLLLAGSACESPQDQISRQKAPANSQGTAPDGRVVFQKNCVVCHGADGKLGLNGAKDLTQTTLGLEERVSQITHGKNLMTPFNGVLSPEEIEAVAAYTLTLKTQINVDK